jgi:hypothetical protein
MLLSLRATVEALLLLTILPALMLILSKSGMPTMSRDLLVAQMSCILIVLGFATLAVSSQVTPAIIGKTVGISTSKPDLRFPCANA